MLLADVVATSGAVRSTASRNAKIEALAELLRRLDDDELAPAVGFLTGELRQGRVGVGWAALSAVEATPGGEPSLTIAALDSAIDNIASEQGPGAGGRRRQALEELLGIATEPEGEFVRRLLVGELRQGALEGVMAAAIARAADVPASAVRRALMLNGDLGRTAALALGGGQTALAEVGLEVLRAIKPMLAASDEDVRSAVEVFGQASVEWKLDGARIQAHRAGEAIRVFTRNQNDVTERLPEVVAVVRDLPVTSVVLDGETITVAYDERPRAFQETMSRFGRERDDTPMVPFFFDCLHIDGADLIDAPLTERAAVLERVAGAWRVPAIITSDVDAAEAFLEQSLAAGHEGVMVKDVASPYAAGRRGKSWLKVKPVRTVDLVVLAADWGHGRRRGRLSNLHLGARDSGGGFVMVGKTFKGMTDELLEWQTETLPTLETERTGHTVHVRPELVVEIALDGVQASTRYPGGVALRFARVKRYRPDKSAAEADTIEELRALLPRVARP